MQPAYSHVLQMVGMSTLKAMVQGTIWTCNVRLEEQCTWFTTSKVLSKGQATQSISSGAEEGRTLAMTLQMTAYERTHRYVQPQTC